MVTVESEAEAERQLRLTIDRDGVVVPFCPLVESETKAERQLRHPGRAPVLGEAHQGLSKVRQKPKGKFGLGGHIR